MLLPGRVYLGFQSTLPVGGATRVFNFKFRDADDFNPRSPWGERPPTLTTPDSSCYFNPRSPWGERLLRRQRGHFSSGISIHAPRGGSDPAGASPGCRSPHFNPRSPWGERPGGQHPRPELGLISIHAPRGGSDSKYAQIHCLYCAERICFLQIILPFL